VDELDDQYLVGEVMGIASIWDQRYIKNAS
jgi:hypothetical protein